MSRDRSDSSEEPPRVRLDKWLWAARIYKTRGIAKQAIEGGKVSAAGHKLKPGKEISPGTVLTVRQGRDDRTIEVLGLSEKRRSASEAEQLYRELPESIERRQRLAEQRRMQPSFDQPPGKPDRKDRRLRRRIKTGGVGPDGP